MSLSPPSYPRFLALALALTGCSSVPGDSGSGGSPPAGDCGSAAQPCLDNQQGCSMGPKGPTCQPLYLTGCGSLPLAHPGPPRSARQSRATLAR